MVYVVSGVEAKWSNLTALKSSLQPHAELPYAKVKAFDCTVCWRIRRIYHKRYINTI